jgi:hypothetical protein
MVPESQAAAYRTHPKALSAWGQTPATPLSYHVRLDFSIGRLAKVPAKNCTKGGKMSASNCRILYKKHEITQK